MTVPFDGFKLLDKTGRQILRLLQEDARMSFAEIGRRVALSAPSVADRVRQMEEAGIIKGYHAAIDPEKVDLLVTAYIVFTSRDGHYERVEEFLEDHPSVSEYYCISGETDILMRVSVANIDELAPFWRELECHGKTATLLVLKTFRGWHCVNVAG